MQLRYCKIAGGNFGDDVNTSMWPELFPDIGERHPQAHLYGVGSILGGACPPGLKFVLGSGCGYGRQPSIDSTWRIYWVRGPRTAQRCGLDPALALGDAAVLWSGLCGASMPIAGRVGLIPHHKSYDGHDWDDLARIAGLHPIDPRQSPSAVTAELATCERVLTESLHGAIFSDALGIPWRAVALARRFNDFKWGDWLDTLGLPLHVAAMHVELQRELRLAKALGNRLARWSDHGGPAARNFLRPLRRATEDDVRQVIGTLRNLAGETSAFLLSDPSRRKAQRDAMRERCAVFARDCGLYFSG